MKKKKITLNSDFVFMACVYLLVAVVVIVTLYPIIFVISASISDPEAVSTGKMLLWPVGFTLQGYELLLQYDELWIGYGNTLFYTIAGTALNMLVTMPAAFALSRKDMKYRKGLMGLFIFTMYFSGGLIPGYLNVKGFGLLDSRAVLLILGLVSVYNLIVARTFFENSIPWELQEAACIDGARKTTVFLKIALPLSKPIIAVLALYYGVGHWNSYFNALIYLQDRTKWPLQMFLQELLRDAQNASQAMGEVTSPEAVEALMATQETANLLKYGIIVVAMVPLLMLYPFLQKFFEKGVMIGAVKG